MIELIGGRALEPDDVHSPSLTANTVSATELNAVYDSSRCFILLSPESFSRDCVDEMKFRHGKRRYSSLCEL